jgi:hypothetical protein
VGRKLLGRAVRSGALVLVNLAPSEIALMQPAQARRKRPICSPNAVAAGSGNVGELAADSAGTRAKKSETIRIYLGGVRRIIVGRK